MVIQRKVYADMYKGEPLPRKVCEDHVVIAPVSFAPGVGMVYVDDVGYYVRTGSWVVWDAGDIRVLTDVEFQDRYDLPST